MMRKKANEEIDYYVFESWIAALKDKEKKRVHWTDQRTRCEC